MATTSDRLKQIMNERKIKQIDLVEMTGIGKSAISQYLSGKVVPKQDKIYLLSQALKINPAWLMGYDVSMESDASSSWRPAITEKDKRDIAKEVDDIIGGLSSSAALSFDADDIDDETRDLLRKSLENVMETARLLAKKKYTPYKYRVSKEDTQVKP